jgi:hypothetical protein
VPFVKQTLEDEHLLQFTGATWTQTTQAMIAGSDVLIFMRDDVYGDAMERFQIPAETSQRWDIPDVQGDHGRIRSAVDGLLRRLKVVDAT